MPRACLAACPPQETPPSSRFVLLRLGRGLVLDVRRRAAPRVGPVDAPANGRCTAVVVPPAPEGGAPPAAPEDDREGEDDDPDDHQDHPDDLWIDASAVRVDRPGQNRPEGDQDQADDESHRGPNSRRERFKPCPCAWEDSNLRPTARSEEHTSELQSR